MADNWGNQYHELREHLDAYRRAVHRLLEELLKTAGIEYAQLESRTKTLDSFKEKVARKGDRYTNPLTDITDLVGLRVIVYFLEDVDKVGKLVEGEFDVDKENSIKHRLDTQPDRFGYRSDHYVIHIGERARFPEWQAFSSNSAEVQVRTVMQHAWAAVDHKIRYKESDLPGMLQRRLFRLSAMLEAADEQFSDLQDEHSQLARSYTKSLKQGQYHMAVDALSLTAYLDQTKVGEQWAKVAVKAGFKALSGSNKWGLAGRERHVAGLLRVLKAAKLDDLQQFRELLDRAARSAQTDLKRVVKAMRQGAADDRNVRPILAIPEDVIAIAVLLEVGNIRLVDESFFRKEIRVGIKACIRGKRASEPERHSHAGAR